jgi:hypothetical protein
MSNALREADVRLLAAGDEEHPAVAAHVRAERDIRL